MRDSTIRRLRAALVALAAVTVFTACTSTDLAPPDESPAPFTQATAGTGWRLLGDEVNVGEAYRTGIATTNGELSELVRVSGLTLGTPEVDWRREVVVWFGMTWGSGCPIRLVDVVAEEGLLHGDFEIATSEATPTCNEDINPHSFLVAVERSALPTGPFIIFLTDDVTHNLADQEATVVGGDLSAPGSVFTPPKVAL